MKQSCLAVLIGLLLFCGCSNQENNEKLNEFEKYFCMNMSEILEMTNGEISNDFDTMVIPESHMFFPYLFDETLGLTFVFSNKVEDLEPICIIITDESNIQDISVLGAKPGMNFSEIREILKDTKIKKTWLANEDNVVYEVFFTMNNIDYRFISYDEYGEDSILYISQQ